LKYFFPALSKNLELKYLSYFFLNKNIDLCFQKTFRKLRSSVYIIVQKKFLYKKNFFKCVDNLLKIFLKKIRNPKQYLNSNYKNPKHERSCFGFYFLNL